MGETTGKNEFTRRHQAKAYLLLKEKAGESIARLEYDPDILSEEILYILDRRELSYPSSWEEVYEEKTQ